MTYAQLEAQLNRATVGMIRPNSQPFRVTVRIRFAVNYRGVASAVRRFLASTVASRRKNRYLTGMNTEFAPLFKLGRAERLQLVKDLWDSIAKDDASSPVPDGTRDELRRRRERYLQHPASGRTWEQVKQRARAHHD